MTQKFRIGEKVFVPCSRVNNKYAGTAFVEVKVEDQEARSITVSPPGENGNTAKIASSFAHLEVGLLLIQCGDFSTESTLTDPLSKSLLHYFRLLLPDDQIQYFRIRSTEELKFIWNQFKAVTRHVVFIGHGKNDAFIFGVDGEVGAKQLLTCFGPQEEKEIVKTAASSGKEQRTFMSLCCETGYGSFAKEFSSSPQWDAFIAPFHPVHGAVASHFCQTFYAHHMLGGSTLKTAFKKARDTTTDGTKFRLWKNGKHVT